MSESLPPGAALIGWMGAFLLIELAALALVILGG